ncbi:MAG: sugar ABC transporter permease [Thermoflexales bacterium]|nr:sugar ABC transporter permease [Thermoflexales bacterium]
MLRRPSRAELRQWLDGYLFALPFLIGFIVFFLFPMVYSAWLAFQKWDLIGSPEFVGLKNITRALSDELATKSLYNSAYYTVIAVPLQLILAFLIALALTQNIKFKALYRAGFYMPIIIPVVATAVVWQRVFHPDSGIINNLLAIFGVPAQRWLSDPDMSKPAFIFMSLWSIGRMMVIFIAGLGNIPTSLLEAASIDGAGKLRQTLSITVPLMTPLILYNSIIALINSFQTWVPADIMTEGGPENSTLFVVLNIYRQGFKFFNMGYASALAWELFAIVMGLTLVQFISSRKWVYYEQ